MNGVKFMIFKIKNFGKITEANIKLDGITVICGDNNTGKSTVGKALFGFFNSLYDLNNKIVENKISKVRNFLFSYAFSFTNIYSFVSKVGLEEIIKTDKITVDALKNIIDNNISFNKNDIKVTKESLKPLVESLNAPVSDIINEVILRNFDNIMNGQIKNVNNKTAQCVAIAKFSEGINGVSFTRSSCRSSLSVPIQHKAYYINSPFVLDWINNPSYHRLSELLNLMEKSVINDVIDAEAKIKNNPMENIFDAVNNKENLKDILDVLKKALDGDITLSNGLYSYKDKNGSFDIRNISAGLKSFALIERMLATGVLKKKDVLILDEPEIHLHSEWQIIYAELIVMLQKYFDLTILLVTHSFQFLESLDFFMKKHGISAKGNYYIPESTGKGVVMKSCGDDAIELKKALTTGSVTLSDLKFKYEMENYREEDN
jgi:predicted ATPase